MWHCNCELCRFVRHDNPFYGKYIDLDKDGKAIWRIKKRDFEEGPCEICPMYHNDINIVSYRIGLPQIVYDFLNVKRICKWCSNVIDCYMQPHLHLCWAKADVEAIQLALCMVLRDNLSSFANRETYHKTLVTKMIRKGGKLPVWATRKERERWNNWNKLQK